jgi:hypothetical protein
VAAPSPGAAGKISVSGAQAEALRIGSNLFGPAKIDRSSTLLSAVWSVEIATDVE